MEYTPTNEQKLIDITFAVGLMIHSHKAFKNMSSEEVKYWINKQLNESGFITEEINKEFILRDIL